MLLLLITALVVLWAAGVLRVRTPEGILVVDRYVAYRAMQWEGPGAAALSIDDRMTIANMAIEAGGKNGIFAADAKTFTYVDERARFYASRRREQA